MELLQAGVDRSMIALWLGHESVETTQIYLNANLALKEEILAKTNPVNGKTRPLPSHRPCSQLPQQSLGMPPEYAGPKAYRSKENVTSPGIVRLPA